jgi:DNA/RNA-binding domain of Phe-tRNA-synthetase-like protein
LEEAHSKTKRLLETTPLEEVPEVVAWREAFLSFGCKPRVARSSFEALMRRVDSGFPQIDKLTDIYNAVSIIHRVPIGGENLDAYAGTPRLILSDGTEPFDAKENGELITQYPEIGEPVWADDLGVTCRRWNWRQGLRTRINEQTLNAIFIVDSLGSNSVDNALSASSRLITELTKAWLDLSITQKLIQN